MPTSPKVLAAAGARIALRPPRASDAAAFTASVGASRRLHGPWTRAPSTPTQFRAFVDRYGGAQPSHAGFLAIRRADGALAGVFNFSEIVRSAFQSAYLGYYALAPLQGQGYMTEGLALALDVAFRQMKLHRVEVNVQPSNLRSMALVERLGFAREGYSRRYLKIGGRWRDHVRFAMLVEEWRTLRQRARAPQRGGRRR